MKNHEAVFRNLKTERMMPGSGPICSPIDARNNRIDWLIYWLLVPPLLVIVIFILLNK